jgi:hypothetical protein
MKTILCALAATGALAVQDTSPPVITLSLAAKHAFDQDCTAHTCPQKNAGGYKSVTCEVDSTESECPLPTCAAYDHHDGVLTCSMYTEAVNVNNQVIPAAQAKTIPFTRNLRAEFLLRYDAVDAAGNDAEQVSFTFIFHEPVPPTLTTEFGSVTATEALRSTSIALNSATRTEAEACSQGGTTAPCTWTIKGDSTANDDYDGDVTANIRVSLTAPGDKPRRKVAQAAANLKVDTRQLGDWTFVTKVHDNAGIFGYENGLEQDNVFTQTVTTTVSDNTKPIITSDDWNLAKGYNDHQSTLECGVDTYVEAHANCWDKRDQWDTATAKYLVKRTAVSNTFVTSPSSYPANTKTLDAAASETTDYKVTYTCSDSSSNAATPTVRTITVQDTTDPVVTMLGQTVVENSAGTDASHAGKTDFENGAAGKLNISKLRTQVGCTDECDTSPTIVATLHFGGDCTGNLVGGDGNLDNFPEYTAGDYSVKYVCSDGNAGDVRTARTHQQCRKIQNVDHTKPTITILGQDSMTLEATHTGNYVDDGAVCSDQVDGVISQNVEVSGDVVNLSKAGAYDITYNCKDSAGNSAPTLHRSVTVKQTTCPTCVLNDAPATAAPLLHEASFPYTDAGAVCSDLIDGIVTTVPTSDVNVEQTGTYTVTYRAKNSVPLWNDDAACRGTANSYFRTVKVVDTLKPIIQLKYNSVEVARSAVLDTGIPDSQTGVAAANPAASGLTLMAEQATGSANAWVLAAAASAVTGLALLGLSSRAATATSVPV